MRRADLLVDLPSFGGASAVPKLDVAKLRGMRKGVKVRRVVRRFELWPVAKVAFFFHLLCYLLTLGVLTGVWFVADRMGTVKNLEKLISRLGWEKFEVHGDVLFRSAAMIGASMAVVATIGTVTLAFFYNMLSGIFGGLVLSVLQEHTDGSSGSRRQRRLAAKRAAKLEHRGDGRPKTPHKPPPPDTPDTPDTKRTLGKTKPKSPAVEPRPAARPRVGRTASPVAIPEGWEPDTVKSLFGDGDLEEEFADDFPDALPNELGSASNDHPDLSWRTHTN
jgi:hypothetical protein